MEYARQHPKEVFTAVGKQFDIDPDFFKVWFTRFSDFPVVMSDQDSKAIAFLWQHAKELGILKNYPPVEQTVWKKALRAADVSK
jgi:hypothetical protein